MTAGISGPQQYARRSLGMFIHFSMATFTNLEQGNPNSSPTLFAPTSLSIDNWVSAAQAMGAQYAVFTAKHSDGFCLYPSNTTTFGIKSAAPWYANSGNLDIVGTFVSKFRAAGIVPCLYYCIADATFQQSQGQVLTQFKSYSSGQLANLLADYNQSQYLSYIQSQLTEILTNYPNLGGIWMDGGYWAMANTYYPWASASQMLSFIHGLQPNIMVCNNSHTHLNSDTDVVEWEGGGAGAPPTLYNAQEFCDTIQSNNQWFWHSGAPLYSTAATVAEFLTCNKVNCSFLLDCPPDTTGNIPAAMLTAMQAIGAAL